MISIIIPAYNSANTIVETLESVRDQTFTDYEVIIVDDCSKDDTIAVTERWIREKKENIRSGAPVVTAVPGGSVLGKPEDTAGTSLRHPPTPRLRRAGGYVGQAAATTEECSLKSNVSGTPSVDLAKEGLWSVVSLPANGGPAMARNRGIQEAHGDWIAFLDADDIWLSHKLELQMRLAVEHPEVVLWCGETVGFQGEANPLLVNSYSLFGNSTTNQSPITNDRAAGTPNNQEPITNNDLRAIRLEDLALRNPIATSTVLVKREVLLAVGGFDTQFRGPEDYDLWLRIAAFVSQTDARRQCGRGTPCRDSGLESAGSGTIAARSAPPTLKIVHCAAPVSRYRQVPGSLSLDDRKFLPQVVRVLNKAFGQGGALAAYGHLKKGAMSSQYWSGSWMAFSRGDRLTAVRLWYRAWQINRSAKHPAKRPWLRMLIRYCCLPRPL